MQGMGIVPHLRTGSQPPSWSNFSWPTSIRQRGSSVSPFVDDPPK